MIIFLKIFSMKTYKYRIFPHMVYHGIYDERATHQLYNSFQY